MTKPYVEEYVPINGITQYFLHYPAQSGPVIVHLHGGPGQSQACFAYCTRPETEYCTFVFYDQRGAGKTQRCSKTPASEVTLENQLEDLRQTICYVKERYATDEVVLLGHSWGSVLGTSYILRYPGDVKGYIGVGQVVDIKKGEQLGFERLCKAVNEKGSRRDQNELERIGDYPSNVVPERFFKQMGRVRKLQMKYKLTVDMSRSVKAFFKSPVFRLSDIAVMLGGVKTNNNLVITLTSYSVLETVEYRTPVCYVLGEDDWQVPSVLAAEYFERIQAPHKELHWVTNAGHLTDFDNPRGFHEAVRAALSGICGTTINND